jgi:predicted nucleotidyltransferase
MAKKLTLPADWVELLRSLISQHVEFVVTGGVAFSFHAKPRFTSDLDLVVRPERANIERFISAFKDFGFTLKDEKPEQLLTGEKLIRAGIEPNRVDIMNFLKGVDLAQLFTRAVRGNVSGLDIPFISIEDLIANKKAVARPEDLADIQKLEKLSA